MQVWRNGCKIAKSSIDDDVNSMRVRECQVVRDRLDSPCPSTGEGKTVEVSLCVGLADWEDAAALSTRSIHTEANEGFGFDVRLFSGQNMGTKAITVPEDPLATAKPDKLYGLEIWQYDRAEIASITARKTWVINP